MGEYIDGFGNRMTVHAVANPHQYGVLPRALNDRAPGFGVVEFDKKLRHITMTNYPRWVDLAAGGKPFPGWPATVSVSSNGENGGRYRLRLPQPISGLIEVFAPGETDPVLSYRSAGPVDVISVWRAGEYRVTCEGRSYRVAAEHAANGTAA
jgi:hypothetical protein